MMFVPVKLLKNFNGFRSKKPYWKIAKTFKALTGRSSNNITELFSKCDNENYNFRSNNTKLSLTKPNTNFLKRSF